MNENKVFSSFSFKFDLRNSFVNIYRLLQVVKGMDSGLNYQMHLKARSLLLQITLHIVIRSLVSGHMHLLACNQLRLLFGQTLRVIRTWFTGKKPFSIHISCRFCHSNYISLTHRSFNTFASFLVSYFTCLGISSLKVVL